MASGCLSLLVLMPCMQDVDELDRCMALPKDDSIQAGKRNAVEHIQSYGDEIRQ